MNRLRLSSIGLLGLVPLLSASPVLADDAGQDLVSRKQLPPALANMQKHGVKMTDLGTDYGVQGFLLESPDGKMQPYYLAGDGHVGVAGILVGPDGSNVTAEQIARLRDRLEAVNHQVDAASSRVTHSALPGAASPGTAADITHEPLGASGVAPHPARATQSTVSAPAAPASAPSAPPSADTKAKGYLSPYKGADFTAAADDTEYFDVGNPKSTRVYMVADPSCPHCHETWQRLLPLIKQGKIYVRVIIVDLAFPTKSELALRLLSNPHLDKAWLRGEGSADHFPITQVSKLGSPEWSQAGQGLRVNDDFARPYIKQGTPLLAYVGQDGKFYSAEGPANLGAFLSEAF